MTEITYEPISDWPSILACMAKIQISEKELVI